MSKSSATLVLVVFVIITLPIFFITIPILVVMHNSLIRKKNNVAFSFAGIDVMLKQRSDNIPNIVAAVKQIMTHERELLESITKLRSNIKENQENAEVRFPLEGAMSQLLGQMSITMEAYPEIKSNENMMHLQRTLNETEEQIGAARRAYNASVKSINDSIGAIPTNVMAGYLSYAPEVYFEAAEQDKSNPTVSQLFS